MSFGVGPLAQPTQYFADRLPRAVDLGRDAIDARLIVGDPLPVGLPYLVQPLRALGRGRRQHLRQIGNQRDPAPSRHGMAKLLLLCEEGEVHDELQLAEMLQDLEGCDPDATILFSLFVAPGVVAEAGQRDQEADERDRVRVHLLSDGLHDELGRKVDG
jgi:hypothetical protein